MLLSRCSNIFRAAKQLNVPKAVVPRYNPTRLSHHVWYREFGAASKYQVLVAELLGGFMWWWILWHLYHEPGHVFGEWDIPDPAKWTDAELGIPPDDVD